MSAATPIHKIPTFELEKDLRKTLADITLCELALCDHITTYGTDKSVAYRLDGNRQIAATIQAELAKRELQAQV